MFPTQTTLRAPMAPRFRLASLLGSRVNQQARIEALRPVNQTGLFEALGEAGITQLTVVFTGLGPAARIDSIAPWASSHPVELPEALHRYAALTWDAPEVEWRDLTLAEAVEESVLDLLCDPDLRNSLPGGAEGEFCFDPKARTVHLEVNEMSAPALPARGRHSRECLPVVLRFRRGSSRGERDIQGHRQMAVVALTPAAGQGDASAYSQMPVKSWVAVRPQRADLVFLDPGFD